MKRERRNGTQSNYERSTSSRLSRAWKRHEAIRRRRCVMMKCRETETPRLKHKYHQLLYTTDVSTLCYTVCENICLYDPSKETRNLLITSVFF